MNGLIRPILDQTLEQILCTFNWTYFPFMMIYQKVHSPLPTFIHCPFKLKIEARVYNKFMIIMFKFINVKEKVVVYVITLYNTCTCLTRKMVINITALYITWDILYRNFHDWKAIENTLQVALKIIYHFKRVSFYHMF